ncbi:MAG: hypothetical protein K2P58_05505 [Hyphomonadaceae bacterium]|nr:hypothetical protein [Hyphomonadaceae bacterium]
MTRHRALWITLCGGAIAAALAGAATAEPQAIMGVELAAPEDGLLAGRAAVEFSVTNDGQAPFLPFDAREDGERRLQLELSAGGGDSPLDVAIAQQTTLTPDANGDVMHEGSSAIVRIGRGLVGERDADRRSSTYVFVASENQALTYQPGSRSAFGGQGAALALQDRVEVGDLSAGVTFERNGVQTSLAYVERSESVRVGNRNVSQDDSFAGVTVTARR